MSFNSGTIQLSNNRTIYIESDAGGALGTFAPIEIGTMNFEHDVFEDAETIKSIGQIQAGIEIKAEDETSNGGHLSNLEGIADAPAEIQYTAGGTTYTFQMRLDFGSIRYNELEKTTRFLLRQESSDRAVSNYITGAKTYRSNGGTDYTAVYIPEFIENYLDDIDSTTTESIINNQYDDTGVGDGDYRFLIADTFSQTGLDIMTRVSVMDGAIWGTAFNTNFYFNRLDTTGTQTLTSSDLEDIQREFVEDEINDVSFGINTTGLDTSIQSTRTDTFSSDTELSDIAVEYNPEPFVLGQFSLADGRFNEATNLAKVNSLLDSGIRSLRYAKQPESLESGVINEGKRLKMTVIGITKLFPWQPFDFDSSVASWFQSRTWRSSTLKYDFIHDTVEVEGYIIA